MVETSFGSLQVENGQARLGTTIFGVDVNSLVDDLVEAKRLPIIDKEVSLSENAVKLAAINELEGLANTLNSAALNLRSPTVAMGGTDAFDQKAAFVQSSNSTQPTQLLAITASESAPVGEFKLTINRLATTDVINSSTTVSAETATPITTDGNLVINGETISLTAGDDLNAIRDAINAKTEDTSVRASIVKINDTTFTLSLQGENTGEAIDISTSDAGILSDLGFTTGGSGQTNTDLSAELVYNGITVNRASNNINDLVDGVTFDLFSADTDAELSVDIQQDASGIKQNITAFVEAYNTLMAFGQSQREVAADGTVSDSAILFNDPTLRNLMNTVQGLATGAVGGVSGINNLREAGISLNANNLLEIDDAVLDDALIANPDEIQALFGFQSTSTNSDFQILSRPTNNAGGNVTVNVLETDVDGRPTSAEIVIDGVTTTADIRNGLMYGEEGSNAEGFTFGYIGAAVNPGDPAATVDFTATQGIADQIGGYLDNLTAINIGAFASVKQELEDSTTRLEDQIISIEERIVQYRDRLTAQFLAAEQQISVLNSVQQSLEAQFEALNGGSN